MDTEENGMIKIFDKYCHIFQSVETLFEYQKPFQ